MKTDRTGRLVKAAMYRGSAEFSSRLYRHSTKRRTQCFFGGAGGLLPEHHNGREDVHVSSECAQREESMTKIRAIRLASVVTAINVLVASGFSIAAIIRPQYLVPAESVRTEGSVILAMYAAARTIPLALFALGAIYAQAMPVLLILGALAGTMQLLDGGIGLFEHDLGK